MVSVSNGLARAVLFISIILFGCAGENHDTLLASARKYIVKNDNNAAIIQLKAALQVKSDSPEARFLLGKAMLDSGDAVSAAVELRKAIALRHPEADTLPVLAKSLIAQGKYKRLIDEYAKVKLEASDAAADLRVSIATAYAMLGEREQANVEIDAVLEEHPENIPALIARLRLLWWSKDFEAAFDLVDILLAKAPDNYEAWRIKGALLLASRNDSAGAIEAYRKALSFKKDDLLSKFTISKILLRTDDIPSAKMQIDELVKSHPNHPRTKYIQAQLAVREGDFKAAREFLQNVLSTVRGDAMVLQLSGAVELQLGSFLQAEKFLSSALQVAPNLRHAQWLLAQTYLRSGQPAKALALSQPILSHGEPEARWLAIAAEAYHRSGDKDNAEKYFVQASKLDPTDSKSRTAVALRQLSKGNIDKAFDELRAISASDSGTFADLTLINVHLQRDEFESAIKAVDNVERKQPDKPFAAYLRGKAMLAQGEPIAARQSFERAVAIDPAYFPAIANLAALDFADKKPKAAKRRFERLLRVDPRNLKALLAIASLRARTGGTKEEVASIIAEAVKLNPDEATPRLRLIGHYLKSKDAKSALVAAQSAIAALPDNPALLAALGRAQMSAGDLNQAINSYTKLAGLQPQSPQAHLGLADVYMARKDNNSAAKSLRRAIEIAPNLLTAQRALIALELVAKRPKEALAITRSIQKQRPDHTVGFLLEGKVKLLQKNFDAAATAFRSGLAKKGATSELARGFHAALTAARKHEKAETFAAQWIKEHSDDNRFLAYLGDLALSQRNYSLAETRYLELLKRKPENVATLSRLAVSLTAIKKPDAVRYAQKAHNLKPDNPKLLAMLARAQMSTGDLSQAIISYTKLASLQPKSPQAHIGLAEVYMASKDNDSAASSLRRALKIVPNLLQAQRVLIALEIAAKRPQKALSIARTVQKQRPNQAIGFMLKGRVEASQKNFEVAIAEFRAGLDKKNAPPEIARGLYGALLASEKLDEADDFAAAWVKDHAGDYNFLAYMGDIALAQRNYAVAEANYLVVLGKKPDHVQVLNNLAYALTALKKPGAVSYAQKANDLNPNQPTIMDTLAMALAHENELSEAIKVQKKAIVLGSDKNMLRMNLAKIYIKAGQKGLARVELNILSKLGDSFSMQTKVQQLLKTL